MKYIIFKEKNMLHPVVFADHTTHSQIKIEGAKPISAGFVMQDKTGIQGIKCYGKSDSLNLTPGANDEAIISSWLQNCGIYAFLSFD